MQTKVLKQDANGRVTETTVNQYLGYTALIGDNTNTSFTVTHNLGTKDLLVQIRRNGSPYDIIDAGIEMTTDNDITITTTTIPSTDEYKVIIIG